MTVAGAGTVFWQAYLAAQRKQPDVPLFPEVRIFAGGGAPKPPHIHYELMAEMGAPAIAGWGLTESPIITMVELDAPDDKKATTEGKACPGVELRVVTVDGALAGRGEEGEMQVRGRAGAASATSTPASTPTASDDRRRRRGSAPATSA